MTSRARGALFAVAVAVAVFAPASARATNRIYWGNLESDVISFTEVSGSGVGADIDTTGATVQHPMGLALDPAHNRIYWANWGSDAGKTISYANLDGSGGGGDLPINPNYVTGPHGLAIDPVAGKLYWPNSDQGTIGYANLDGSAAGFLPTGVATIDHPRGLAIDPATGRIYWANYGGAFGTTISYASLNGTGGADLANVTGATVEGPEGVALDPPNNRIYWGNFGPGTAGTGDTIAYANLDGTGDAANLTTPGANIARVHGVAIDPTAGRIYWANYGYATPTPGNSTLASAALDGSGGGQIHVDHNAVTEVGPELPVLLDQPQGISAPVVSGTATVGSTLNCTQGTWAQDLISALLYRAPQNLAYAWTRDGVPLDGATSSSTTAAAPGAYRCVVSASNAAGTSGQTSAPLTVPKPASPFTIATGSSGGDPRVDLDANGNGVAVWRDPSDQSVWARRVAADGTLGSAIPVAPTDASGDFRQAPQVAVDGDGDAIVTWTRTIDATDKDRIEARTISATGTLGSTLNLSGDRKTGFPQIAVNDSGDAIVVWSQGSGVIRAQLLGVDGTLGPARSVAPAGEGGTHSVGIDGSGNAVVVWHTAADQTVARTVSDAGVLGHTLALSIAGAGAEIHPSVAVGPSGAGFAVWPQTEVPGTSKTQVAGRSISTAGVRGPLRVLTASTDFAQDDPQVAVDADGDAIAAWTNEPPRDPVRERRISSTGVLGATKRLNPGTDSGVHVNVGVDSAGNAVFVWEPLSGGTTRIDGRTLSTANALGPVQTLSASGGKDPDLDVTAAGKALAVWELDTAMPGPDRFKVEGSLGP